jgi:gliding motility-associated-like protein
MKLVYCISFFILLFCTRYTLFSQEPTVTIISRDTAFCESGNALLKVKFTGSPPFAFAYKDDGAIFFEDGGGSIFGYEYEKTLSLNSTADITLHRVYDNNYQLDINDREGSGVGNVTGNMHVQIDRMPIVDAGNDTAVCGLSYVLEGHAFNELNTIWWSDMPAYGSFDNLNDPQANFSSYTSGTYTFTLNETSGKCEASDNVDITFYGNPRAHVDTGEMRFCSSDNVADTIGVTINFSGNEPFTYVMQKSNSIFDPVTTSSQVENVKYIVDTPGVFTLYSVEDVNGCRALSADLTGSKRATDVKPNAFAGENNFLCGDEFVLQAQSSPNTIGSWSYTSTNIAIDEQELTNPNATVRYNSLDSFQEVKLVWNEITTDELSCPNSQEITLSFALKPEMELISISDHICEGDITTPEFLLTGNTPLTIEYTDGVSIYTKSNINTHHGQEILSPLHTSDYDLSMVTEYSFTKLTGAYGCETVYTDKLYTVTIDKAPFANAGYDTSVCNRQIELFATPSIGEGKWIGLGQFSDEFDPYSEFMANNFGEQKLVWTEVNGVCISKDTVSVNFQEAPYPVNAGPDTIIYALDNIFLYALPVELGAGSWSILQGSATIEETSMHNSRLVNVREGIYELVWNVSLPESTCPDIQDTVVIDSRNLLAPTGFSPNNDGVHDCFEIMGAENISNNKLSVFDKNGKLVFSRKNYANSWKGTDRSGNILPTGTYYYIFEGDQLNSPIKNYLIIKK